MTSAFHSFSLEWSGTQLAGLLGCGHFAVESKVGMCMHHGGTWVSGKKKIKPVFLFQPYLIFILYFISIVGIITVVQSLSHVQLFATPMNHSTPGLPVHHQLPESTKPMSIELVMTSNHLILHCPLLLLHSIFPSIRVFSNESVLRINR